MNRKLNLLFAFSLTLAGVASAQSDSSAPTAAQFTSLNDSFLKTKTTVDKLNKLSVGGYIQAQYQLADSLGSRQGGVDGGAFPAQSDQRFQIRRARLKTTYNGVDAKYVVEVDVLPSGLSIKDAYAQFTEPWLKTFSLTMGNMDRPYGFEIGQSSGAMEWAERSRLEQNIFHNEKDLGAKIEVNPTPDMGYAQYLNLKAGLYTGTGGGQGSATGDETDNKLDFIGRAGFRAPMQDMGFEVDGGASAYIGHTQDLSGKAFSTIADSMVATTGDSLKWFDRTSYGVDLQATYKIPVIGNMTLRGEYSTGKAPTTATSTQPYGLSTAPIVQRNFMGWYAAWIQNFTPMFQTVVRYDVYDPNTDVSGTALTTAKGFSTTDIMYSDLGLGLNFYWGPNLKFLAYYDMPTNENAGIAPYTADVNDNVFTFRMQTKF